MDVRKFVLKETRIIAIGECIGVAAMWGIYALLGRFDRTVLLGGIVGAVIAVLNFFLSALLSLSSTIEVTASKIPTIDKMLSFSDQKK